MKLEKKNSIRNLIKIISVFYTTWTLLFWLIGTCFMLRGLYVNRIGNILLVMLTFISVGGFTIAHIYPRVLCHPYTGQCFCGWKSKLIDLFTHHFPLFIHLLLLFEGKWVLKKRYITEGFLWVMLMVMFYMCGFNPWKIYLSTKARRISSELNSNSV